MESTPKFRLRLNLFDGIILLLAIGAAVFLLWKTMKPAAPVQSEPTATSTVRYTICFKRCLPGTGELIQAKDRITDNIRNYNVGQVVSAQAIPATYQVLDTQNRRYVWTNVDGYEDVLVTIEAPCVITDAAITVGGGYEIRVGSTGYFKGEGYMGSGPIVAIEEVRG